MTWALLATAMAYGIGACVVALWYGGATVAPKSRRHLGSVASLAALITLAVTIYLLWWYFGFAVVVRALHRRGVARRTAGEA